MSSFAFALDQVAKLDSAIKSNDPKILQMELQGSIGTTVNQVGSLLSLANFPKMTYVTNFSGSNRDRAGFPAGAL